MQKTTVTLDHELVARVGQILGTNGIKATLDGALHEVLVMDARRRELERLRTMDGLDLNKPDVMAQAWR